MIVVRIGAMTPGEPAEARREVLAGDGAGVPRLRTSSCGSRARRLAAIVAHAAASSRVPPVIANPSSSSVAVGGNSPTMRPS